MANRKSMDYRQSLQQLPLPSVLAREVGVYWKPTVAFLDELETFIGGRKVLEIFAGNGFLTAHLANRGLDIKATTVFSGHDAHNSGVYFEVEELNAEAAVFDYGSERDVLLVSWPTVTEAALRAVALWGESKDIIFIGEVTDYSKNQLGGCATDEFFEHVRFNKRFLSYEGSSYESALVGRFSFKKIELNRALFD